MWGLFSTDVLCSAALVIELSLKDLLEFNLEDVNSQYTAKGTDDRRYLMRVIRHYQW